jgi:hypothetical protein
VGACAWRLNAADVAQLGEPDKAELLCHDGIPVERAAAGQPSTGLLHDAHGTAVHAGVVAVPLRVGEGLAFSEPVGRA